MARQHFLIKSEPYKYSWDDLVRDGRAVWDGVRSFEARNNLRLMKVGDQLLFYHSNEGKEIVGVAEVLRKAYADPTADEGDWSAVDVGPVQRLERPVTLDAVRKEPRLSEIALVRRSRVSVVPITPAEFAVVLELGKAPKPRRRATAARGAAAAGSR